MRALLRRILLAPLPRLVWTAALAFVLGRLVRWVAPWIMAQPNVVLAGAVRNAVFTLVVFTLALFLFERKLPSQAGLAPARAVPDTVRGFVIGAALLTVVTGVLALAGSYRILGWAPLPEGTSRALLFAKMTLMFLAVGIFEEVLSRGILFRQLEQAIGTWLAMAVSALLFGLGHRNNPGATVLSSLAIMVEAGGLLAAAYVATRSLWLPIGIHWAWNLFEGPVWGSLVSGNEIGVLARASFPGPTLLTGGAFGPEAGLPAMVLGTALGVAFVVVAIRRNQIVTPRWMHWIAGRLPGRAPETVAPEPARAVPPPAV
jgi:hypothetical protein